MSIKFDVFSDTRVNLVIIESEDDAFIQNLLYAFIFLGQGLVLYSNKNRSLYTILLKRRSLVDDATSKLFKNIDEIKDVEVSNTIKEIFKNQNWGFDEEMVKNFFEELNRGLEYDYSKLKQAI